MRWEAELFWPLRSFSLRLLHLDWTSQPDFREFAPPFDRIKGLSAYL